MGSNPHKVNVNGGARRLELEGGRALLFALEDADIFLPSACGGRGICGKCRLRVLSGGGDVNDTERNHLSEVELRDGWRLACQLSLEGDLEVEIPDEALRARAFSAVVSGKRRLTYDMIELTLDLDERGAVAERPGQYVRLEVPFEGRPVHRAYSIASPASQTNSIVLVVRLVPEGVGSLYVHRLEKGDRVSFTGPYGEFELREDPEVEIICVGGGSGIAPIKNVIYSIYERWPERKCWLFFGCRAERDVFYYDEFNALAREHPAFKVVYALSEPGEGSGWKGETGFIHLAVDKHLDAGGGPRQALLSGPPPMVEAAMKVLEAKGLAPGDMYYDRF